jgi:hypothetical protein
MKCLYCNVTLEPLRSLTDGAFCCDGHRDAHRAEEAADQAFLAAAAEQGLMKLEQYPRAYCAPGWEARADSPVPVRFAFRPIPPAAVANEPWAGKLPQHSQLFRLGRKQQPRDAKFSFAETSPSWNPIAAPEVTAPKARFAPDPSELLDGPDETGSESRLAVLKAAALSAFGDGRIWKRVRDVWTRSPHDLRLMTLVMPALILVALAPSVPKVRMTSVAQGNLRRAFNSKVESLKQNIASRAAVDYGDDFRSGLDDWEERDNAPTNWSYDQAGFVHPGALALYKPTLEMTDYRFEFLGAIEQKGLGCVFRAADTGNYYALKLVVAKPGPVPLVHLVRYAVIGGKEVSRVDKPLPITVYNDMLYRILVDVRDSDFTVVAQGQVVDFWSDERLKRGGVGLFCSRGEQARIRWVEVSHQYDALGRLCAYLAPYGLQGRTGNWN